jgi:hypothetical protein
MYAISRVEPLQKEALRAGEDMTVIEIGEAKRVRIGCSDPKARHGNEAERQEYLQQNTGGTFHKTIVISEE